MLLICGAGRSSAPVPLNVNRRDIRCHDLSRIQISAVAMVLFTLFLASSVAHPPVMMCRQERCDLERGVCSASSQLDVRGLLDAIFLAALSRYLRRSAGQPLYLPRVRHYWQAWSGQVQPDQLGDARERALVFIGVLQARKCSRGALQKASCFA